MLMGVKGAWPSTQHERERPAGNNIAHLQFVSHDPDAHIDLDVIPLEWEKQFQTSQSSESTAEAGWSRDDVEEMLRCCDVDGSWPDYRFKIARAIRAWDGGGSRGKAVWLAWVRQGTRSPHDDDYERSYDQEDGTGTPITIGTLYEFATKAGYLRVNQASRDGCDGPSRAYAHAGTRDGGAQGPSHPSQHDIPRLLVEHDAFAFSPLGAAHSFLLQYSDRIMIAAEERQTRGVEYYAYLLDERGVWQRESPWVMALIGDCVRYSLHEAWAIMTDAYKKPEKEHRSALWSLARNAGSSGFQKQVSDVLYQAAQDFQTLHGLARWILTVRLNT